MKKWEDIVKDKLAGYESALPEGSLADFRARRSQVESAAGTRRFPLAWVLVPALAAGLAAVLLLHKPGIAEEGIQVIQQPSAPVAIVPDSTVDNGTMESTETAVQNEKADFEKYVAHKLGKLQKSLDRDQLREIFLNIYANPVLSKELL